MIQREIGENDFIQKYGNCGLDRNVISWLVNSSSPKERQTMLAYDEEFFKKYTKLHAEQEKSSGRPRNPLQDSEEALLQKAIIESTKNQQGNTYEPLNVSERLRQGGEGVGLKNIGNTCYFNSLMQTIFRIPTVVQGVMEMEGLDQLALPSSGVEGKRLKLSVNMMECLKDLFAGMICSNQKYENPAEVINKCADDQGEIIKIGDQKDIVEFMISFLSRMEDAFNLKTNSGSDWVASDIPDEGPISSIGANRAFLTKTVPAKADQPLFGSKLERESNLNQSMFDAAGDDQDDGDLLNRSLQFFNSKVKNSELSSKFKATLSIAAQSFIQKSFMGTAQSFIISPNSERVSYEGTFGPMMLSPHASDFYKAWENYFRTELDGFEASFKDLPTTMLNSSSKKPVYYKWDFVKKFPDVLTFQINRAEFNLETKGTQKTHKKFDIPLQVFTDRFLLENKEIIQKWRLRSEDSQEKLEKIEKGLESLEKFGKGNDLFQALGDSLNFMNCLDARDNSSNLPFDLLTAGLNQEETYVKNGLANMKKKLESYREGLLNKKAEIKNFLASMYKGIERNRYILFSVIIHEGSSDGGHYYNYLRLDKHGNWLKCNDFNMKKVHEAEVLANACGDEQSTSSAYCVFYMKEEIFNTQKFHSYELYSRGIRGTYFDLVKGNTLEKILKKNQNFSKVV